MNWDSLKEHYEYALKWKIHASLVGLGSLEDALTQVCVYDLTKIHQHNHRNTFWDRSRHLQHFNTCYLNFSYDTLMMKTRSLILEQGAVLFGSSTVYLLLFFFLTRESKNILYTKSFFNQLFIVKVQDDELSLPSGWI